MPEAKLLENDFYMSENLNTENNLLVPSTRRNLFKGVATGLVAGSVAGPAILSGAKKGKKAGVKKGRINQSVVSWCFADHWSVEETCKHARDLGCKSVELIASKHWPVLKKYGLTCAISGIPVEGPPFIKGYNNPEYHGWLIKATKQAIDESADFGCPNVIAFTGFSENFSKEDGAKNCIEGFKKVAGYAEKKGITI